LLRHTIASNSKKTHPFQSKYSKHPDAIHLHAEIAAIAKARTNQSDLSDCELYVVRVKHDGGNLIPALAKPCPGCWGAIRAFGIREVYYTGA